MLLRELLPSVLLLDLLLDDFENFNMEGKGGGVEKVFVMKETHKINVHLRLCTLHGTSIFGAAAAAAAVVLLLFYQRE